MNKKILTIATIILALDQISKIVVTSFLKLNESITVISKFFYITLCHNEGAAWGILSNHKYLIIIATIIAMIIIYHFIYCFKENKRNYIAFGLLIGGLAGNLIDRLMLGYVRDFFDFFIFNYDYPVFNIADIAIVVGVFLLIIAVLKGEDLSENNSKRKSGKTRQISGE